MPKRVIGDNRHILVKAITLRQQRCTVRIPYIVRYDTAFLFQVFLPLSRRHLGFLERSPPIAVTIEGTVSGDGDVLSVERIKRAGTPFGGDAFEPLVVDLVEVQVVAELYEAVLLRIEPHIGFERDRSGGVKTFGEDHRTTSYCRASINSVLNRFGCEHYTGVVGSKVQHIESAVREGGYLHLRHVERRGFGQAIDVALLGRLVLRRCTSA